MMMMPNKKQVSYWLGLISDITTRDDVFIKGFLLGRLREDMTLYLKSMDGEEIKDVRKDKT